jgi:hypothetical protein
MRNRQGPKLFFGNFLPVPTFVPPLGVEEKAENRKLKMKSRRSKSRKSKVGDESALKKGARASCPLLHRSWDILSQSIAGRAMRPRSADSFRKIYRQAVVLMGK